jgi:hypothetical protein
MVKLRDADFRVPKTIADSDFDEIFATSHIPPSHRSGTKKALDALVSEFGERMKAKKRQPSRKSDQNQLKKALLYVEKAAARIDKLGPSGQLAMRRISRTVAPMLSAQWLHETFFDDDLVPQKSPLTPDSGLREPSHNPLRSQEYFVEEKSLEARLEFVQHRPVRTTSTVLREVKNGLAIARLSFAHQPRAKGGQEPLMARHLLIVELAMIWTNLGRNVSTTATSVSDWRNLTQKNAR